jgi:hypothetical protein
MSWCEILMKTRFVCQNLEEKNTLIIADWNGNVKVLGNMRRLNGMKRLMKKYSMI